MHCAVHADARTTPLPLPSLVRHPFPLSLRSRPLSLSLARAAWSPIFFSTLFFPPSRASASPTPSFTAFSPRLPPSVLFSPRPFFLLSLSLSVYSRVCTLHSSLLAVFYHRSFLDRRQLLSLSQSRSISVVTRDSLSISLCVCHSLAVFPPLPPMRIGSPFFEFRGTTHAWYRHRRGTFLDFRLRLRWAGRERAPARFFDTLPPRRCVQ